jgi:hypothetical protein
VNSAIFQHWTLPFCYSVQSFCDIVSILLRWIHTFVTMNSTILLQWTQSFCYSACQFCYRARSFCDFTNHSLDYVSHFAIVINHFAKISQSFSRMTGADTGAWGKRWLCRERTAQSEWIAAQSVGHVWPSTAWLGAIWLIRLVGLLGPVDGPLVYHPRWWIPLTWVMDPLVHHLDQATIQPTEPARA